MLTQEAKASLVATIVNEVHPQRIVLFGSKARGDDSPYSDIDILVITDESYGPGHSRWPDLSRLYRALARFPAPVDILLYGADEVEKWRTSRCHVLGYALREGRVLYE